MVVTPTVTPLDHNDNYTVYPKMAIRSKVLLERRNDELQQLNAGDGIREVSSKKFNLVPG